MITYILRRILWMIPTLFVICLIVFLIINIVPGEPGELAGAEGQETARDSDSKREAQRIFREQFHLNKPILFNTHWRIKEKEIENAVFLLARQKYMFSGTMPHGTSDVHLMEHIQQAFYENKQSLSLRSTTWKWSIYDCKHRREYLIVKLYGALVLIGSPMDTEGKILRYLAQNIRYGVDKRDMARYVAENAPEYLLILDSQEKLENGVIPPKVSSLLKSSFISPPIYEKLNNGIVSEGLRQFAEQNRYAMSNEAIVREWWMYDPDNKREYRFIKKDVQFSVYRQENEILSKDIIKAESQLENYGQYAITHLVRLIETTDNEDIRRVAVRKFIDNAKERRVFREPHHLKMAGPQVREVKRAFSKEKKSKEEHTKAMLDFINREFSRKNRELDKLAYHQEDPIDKREKTVANIVSWYEKHRHFYQYGKVDKCQITILDTRFAHYMKNLFYLDFGVSHVGKKEPVFKTVLEHLQYSIWLSLISLILSYMIAVPLGIFSAIRQNTVADQIITVILFMFYSLPNFFAGMLLLMLFSKGGDYPTLQFFPTGGFPNISGTVSGTTLAQLKDIGWHLVLPVTCLTITGLASLSRYSRTGIIDVIRSDYIKTARAKGLPEYLVILRHALRNGMIPILTLLGAVLPVLIGGAIVIEYIFDIEGMGMLTLQAIDGRDYNTTMCITLISAVLVMIGILLSDISYALLDPRISFK